MKAPYYKFMLFHENNYYHFCFALFKSTKSGRPVSIALNRRATLISINAWKDQLHALKLKKNKKTIHLISCKVCMFSGHFHTQLIQRFSKSKTIKYECAKKKSESNLAN